MKRKHPEHDNPDRANQHLLQGAELVEGQKIAVSELNVHMLKLHFKTSFLYRAMQFLYYIKTSNIYCSFKIDNLILETVKESKEHRVKDKIKSYIRKH